MESIEIQLTKHFNLDELIESVFFEAKNEDGVPYQTLVNQEFFKNYDKNLKAARDLASFLEEVRAVFGHKKAIMVNIAWRPLWWEKLQGRSGSSQHVVFNAADIRVAGMHPHKVYEKLDKAMKEGRLSKGGLGKYNTFTHVDKRGTMARWDFS